MYVLGVRVHEVALGLGVLALLGAGLAAGLVRDRDTAAVLGGIGLWLVIKDWRDLFPRWRNTQTHRRFGVHLSAGRTLHLRLDLPRVAALATLVVAAVNAASALTPNVAWRGHLLLRVEPVAALPVFHAIALPASAGLALTAVYLARRRRRALLLAVGLLLTLAVADALKGLDLEEAALSIGLAGALVYGRGAFDVRHEQLSLRAVAGPLCAAAVTVAAAGTIGVCVAGRTDPSVGLAADEAAALLAWRSGPVHIDDPVAAAAVRVLFAITLVALAWVVFRPRRPLRTAPELRHAAAELVRAHGRDTLAAFKLRRDAEYLFEPGRRAFVGYRVERGVLVVAGDPVGHDDAIPAVIAAVRRFAAVHGLRPGAVGASETFARRWREVGLRALYIGDEAIVDSRTFSLEGRAVRKVRQSVSRLAAAGFTASGASVRDLGCGAVAELDAISARWLGDDVERGFAMTVTDLGDDPAGEGLVVVARDAEGCARGWLHFLPTYGRPAMSLALMRRDPATPNGLMEFLVVRSLELLRDRGVEEVSLNFAAFARPFHNPRGKLDRMLGRLLRLGGRWFQIESLYRFNAKFSPRWEPRYLLYPSSAALPAVGLAVLAVEGQLPRRVAALLRSGAVA